MAFDFPSSPTTGQTYSISGGPTYVYNGTAWVVLTPGNQFNRTVFTATAGQTSFAMNYVVGAIDVYRNGVKLVNTSDFTATNGTSIVLANGCTVGDTIEVISYPMITYSDAVKRTGDTMTGALAVPSLTVNSVPVLAGPAFSAYQSSNQSISTSTTTKLLFQTEDFDTNSAYDTSTGRFTPSIAGYYQINLCCRFGTNNASYETFVSIGKNGGEYVRGMNMSGQQASGGFTQLSASVVLYLNGSGDYVECFIFQSSGSSKSTDAFSWATRFNGYLVRAA